MKKAITSSLFLILIMFLGTIKPAGMQPIVVCDLITQADIPAAQSAIMQATKQEGGSSASWLRPLLAALAAGKSPRTIQAELQEKLFELLGDADPKDAKAQYQGITIPALICKHLKKTASPEEILPQIHGYIDSSEEKNKKILKAIANLMMDPDLTALSLKPTPTLIKLFKEVKEKKPNIEFALSTNCHDITPFLSLDKFKPLFDFFEDRICYSGKIGAVKPSTEYFDQEQERLQLDPEQTFFIECEKNALKARIKREQNCMLWEAEGFGDIKIGRDAFKDAGILE